MGDTPTVKMPYKEACKIGMNRKTRDLLDSYRCEGEEWKEFFQRLILLARYDAGEITITEDGRVFDTTTNKPIEKLPKYAL